MRGEKEIPVLLAEIEDELSKLKGLTERLSHQKDLFGNEERIESVALRLHNFYTGCERIFKLIAADVNDFLPDRSDWHKRLLTQVALDIEGVRPAVISRQVRKGLDELLAFRHLVRSIYGYELDPIRIQHLVEHTLAVFPEFESDLRYFMEFLRELYKRM